MLVLGVGGGVGVATAQIARGRGIKVIGTASAGKKAFVESLGAVHVAYGDGLTDRIRAAAPDGVDPSSTWSAARTMLGEFDEARELVARARRLLVERIRARRPLMFVTGWSAEVEFLAGDLGPAEAELWTALELAIEIREREWVAQFAAGLSRVLSIQGSEEAARFALLSAETAPLEDVPAQALWRSAKARVLVTRDEPREAEPLAREAVELVPPDMLNLRADLHVDLAEVLLATGQREAALPVIREAIALYERKGNLASSARAASVTE